MSHPLARQSLSSRLTLVVFISSSSLRIHHHHCFTHISLFFPPPPCVSIFIPSPSLRIHHHHCFTHISLLSPPPPCVSITIIVSPTYHSSLLPLPAYPSPSLFHPHITLLSSPSLRIHHHHCFTHISLFSLCVGTTFLLLSLIFLRLSPSFESIHSLFRLTL